MASMKVIFGTMTIGKKGHPMARLHTTEEAKAMIDIFQKYGHHTVDTARVYSEGTSESYLGSLDWPARGIKVDTKLYPTALRGATGEHCYHHWPEDLRRGLMNSLAALKTDKVTTWYLHGPDRTVPFEVTLREVDKLHKEGHFERYGLCNFQAWEVAEICQICERYGFVKPAIYQGLYNAFHRAVEAELFPCLHRYNMSFYCFNPLAAGMLTSRYTRENVHTVDKGSRFDTSSSHGKLHADRYFDSRYFDALEILRPVAAKYGLTEVECALRWLSHHSKLYAEKGDGIVLGASSVGQLEQNLKAVAGPSLPEEVVQAIDAGYAIIHGKELKYWH
ncbi:NADP-dependent oxidoreductase domain-containing protein [Xylariales sp. PMI_506]|nr:NADP-dependent oxidoreductase domain-containing protein [Xylariales sp. PMI_506]